ncbi:granulocyte-macrophage colony-stimulating factor receptor subunit alpha isoform X2 [Castor canadensis]|uniref:Granulocyte-macrophage colony-stimulating factor receptor subunit alpha isoform X2 n=1 Tax=Castor canadensis TaxID=51338 RepID=A0AC58LTP0_CASCN
MSWSLNVTFDPRTMTLRWPCQENTTNVRCILIPWEKGPIMSRGGECSCTFMQESLHRGLTLEVQATVNQRPVQEKLLYTNPGADGTAVQNFSCSIYNAGFMNCTWVKGRAAPDDVQYFMYIKNKRTLLEMECPCYLQESGIHTGCHLSNLSLLSVKSYVLVNGSSPAMGIQFFDSIFLTKGIEKLDPPANVTVHCNVSHCHVRWHQPRTWHRFTHQDFQYQLDIQRQNIDPGNLNPLINISGNSENKYHFPSPEPRHKHTVQIRVADTRRPQWSAWSRPVEFGSEDMTATILHLHLLLVALGTLICALMLLLLLKRFVGTCDLFPTIPQVRDKVSDNHQQTVWEDFVRGPGKGEDEEVLTVEEVSNPFGGHV